MLPERGDGALGRALSGERGVIIQWGGGREVSPKAVLDPLPVSENPGRRHPERLLAAV